MFPGVSRRGPHIESPRLPVGGGGGGGGGGGAAARTPDRGGARGRRKGLMWWGRRCMSGGLVLVGLVFFAIGVWHDRSMTVDDGLRRLRGGGARDWRRGRPAGSVLRFVPSSAVLRWSEEEGGLDRVRSERESDGIRPPRLALVVGTMDVDSQSLMLLTLTKGLAELGYRFTVFALADGDARYLWDVAGYQVSLIGSESSGFIDWSNYEGVILSSLEGKRVISSLMQEPFLSVPVVWIIQEDILGKRLRHYAEESQDLIGQWRSAFSRADVVVFPDFSLPMLYTSLDTGNFFVISGSPADIWAAKSYTSSISRDNLREAYGFGEKDLMVLVIGNYFFYDEIPWDYAAAMHALAPQIVKLTRVKAIQVQFAFLCGISADGYESAFQELATHMGFPDGSVRHYAMDSDVNSLLMMADIVLYGSFQEEPSFPSLLLRAMSFKVPILAPNLTVIKKYITNEVHGFLFHPRDAGTLARAFSLVIGQDKLSVLAGSVASKGKLIAENMLAYNCISAHAKLLEIVLQFPSEAILPGSASEIRQYTWLWDLFERKIREKSPQDENHRSNNTNIVDLLEIQSAENLKVANDTSIDDYPTQLDWDDLADMEISEDIERRELQELEERVERTSESWEGVYQKARKAEKWKFEGNERDDGELERTGQPVCVYEIYSGEGAWPFLNHGSMYRGITLSKSARRSKSDDVDAVTRLPILNETYCKDILCELGAMFAIANKVDSIHKLPWIGFQSWRAAGKKVSLSKRAEETLEETMLQENKGDTIYYWVPLDMDQDDVEKNMNLNFWSMCDHLNAGRCSALFEGAFRQMYGLPENMSALPPMLDNGDHWSSLHSWVMPTPSFLEFIMFSRMFVDSLDSLNNYGNPATCMLGSSKLEKKHCYCRLLELLVNVWAYHSARRMFYLNPVTGELVEQHPLELREMWLKYFDFALLKSMDEDLAEEADDGLHLKRSRRWLWPLTGEVHWQGIFDREREERYRRKMDKKRKAKDKLLDRQKFGYKQKALGQ